jgi:hypothetical protein
MCIVGGPGFVIFVYLPFPISRGLSHPLLLEIPVSYFSPVTWKTEEERKYISCHMCHQSGYGCLKRGGQAVVTWPALLDA